MDPQYWEVTDLVGEPGLDLGEVSGPGPQAAHAKQGQPSATQGHMTLKETVA